MRLILLLLLGAVWSAVIALCGGAREPPAPPLPARPVGQEPPMCLERWLELPDEAPYDHRRFDAQIDHMLRSTARWRQWQEERN